MVISQQILKKKFTFFASMPFIYLISYLPEKLFYGFADFVAFLLRDVFSYRKHIVLANLKASFPAMSLAEVNRTMHAFYINLADTLLESLRMRAISPVEIGQRFQIEGLELLKKYLAEGRTVVAVTGHYANWEWGGLAISAALKENPVLLVYQPMSNQYHEKYFNSIRSRFGSTMVSVKNVLRELVANKHQATLMVMVADQSPTHSEKNQPVQFLNQPTLFFNGPEKIVRRMNAVLMFAEIRRVSRGYYQVKLVPLVKDPVGIDENEITLAHVRRLEQMIQNKPSDWLWSHRRWKLQQA